jgi:hypothetical protein
LAEGKRKALEDPEGFLGALERGELGREGDDLFGSGGERRKGRKGRRRKEWKRDDEEAPAARDAGAAQPGSSDTQDNLKAEHSPTSLDDADDSLSSSESDSSSAGAPVANHKFPPLPQAQNVVKVPNINWAQYGIIGESLDKLHEDQLKHPAVSGPARLAPDGSITAGLPGMDSGNSVVGGAGGGRGSPGKGTPVVSKGGKAPRSGKKRR